MRTVCFINKKGGVGKSSCVHHLGIRLAQMGHRTLLIDADPQASLSQGLLGRDALTLDPAETLAALFEFPGTGLGGLIRPTGRDGLSLVPGHDRMMTFNSPDPWDSGITQYLLRDMLADVADDFDLCLVDGPPHVMQCAWSALVAADGVVIPTLLEDYGVQGVAAILDVVRLARDLANPGLRLLGILPSMFDKRLAIHRDYREDSAAAFGPDLFDEVMPLSVDFKTSLTMRRGITEHKPRGEASKALCRVADEVLARLDGVAVQGTGAETRGVA
jgi:chromosome partitioning protein